MPDPFRTDDELVSAVLDGEATADERARVAADPGLTARLAEFAAVADAVSAPVSLPSANTRDAAIATAVAEARRTEKVVVALRPRRSPGSFLAVAAAVLVVLLFAGFLIGRVGDGGGEYAGDSASDDSAGADGGEESGGAEAADEATAESTDDPAAAFDDAPVVDLGVVDDEDALREALVASGRLDEFDTVPTTRPSLPPTPEPGDLDAVPGDSEACLVRLEEADPGLGGVLIEGTATYAGTPAVVYVFGTVDGDQRVIVVADATCETLVAFPL